MELAVSKIGQKVCHCFVLRYKNIKMVNSVQVQVARTRDGVNILSSSHPLLFRFSHTNIKYLSNKTSFMSFINQKGVLQKDLS